MTGIRLVPLLAVLLATAVGCSTAATGQPDATAGGFPPAPPTVTSATAPPDPDRAFSATDIGFLADMLAHHAVAAQLMEIAEQRADAPGVRRFATDARAAQQREVDQMQRWLTALGVDPDTAGGHDHGGGPTAQDVADLQELSGDAFDRRFLDLVAAHSVGATALAKAEARDGFNTAVRRLAGTIAQREWDDLATLRRLA